MLVSCSLCKFIQRSNLWSLTVMTISRQLFHWQKKVSAATLELSTYTNTLFAKQMALPPRWAWASIDYDMSLFVSPMLCGLQQLVHCWAGPHHLWERVLHSYMYTELHCHWHTCTLSQKWTAILRLPAAFSALAAAEPFHQSMQKEWAKQAG